MKKICALLLAIVTIFPMNSQIVKSRTFGEKKSNPTTWYVRAGLSLNNLTGSAMPVAKDKIKELIQEDAEDGVKSSAGFGPRAGYDFEIGFRKNFGKSRLYWGMELGLGTRGGSYHSSYSDNDSFEGKEACYAESFNIKYMPLQIGYLFPLTEKLSVDGHVGIFASYDFSNKSKGWEEYEGEKDVEDFTEDAYFQGFDAGLKLGIGVWYGRFNFDLSWQRGFATYLESFPFGNDWYKDGDQKYFQSSNLILSLGVSF